MFIIPDDLKLMLKKHTGNYIPIAQALEKMVRSGKILRYSLWTHSIFVYGEETSYCYLVPIFERTSLEDSKIICRNWGNDA